jgi:hypothetical protein
MKETNARRMITGRHTEEETDLQNGEMQKWTCPWMTTAHD